MDQADGTPSLFRQIISDHNGKTSSMRVMLLAVVGVALLTHITIVACAVLVVLRKSEFPAGMWQAMASIVAGVASVAGAKMGQSYFERRTPGPVSNLPFVSATSVQWQNPATSSASAAISAPARELP